MVKPSARAVGSRTWCHSCLRGAGGRRRGHTGWRKQDQGLRGAVGPYTPPCGHSAGPQTGRRRTRCRYPLESHLVDRGRSEVSLLPKWHTNRTVTTAPKPRTPRLTVPEVPRESDGPIRRGWWGWFAESSDRGDYHGDTDPVDATDISVAEYTLKNISDTNEEPAGLVENPWGAWFQYRPNGEVDEI